jgi:hypothetical protein
VWWSCIISALVALCPPEPWCPPIAHPSNYGGGTDVELGDFFNATFNDCPGLPGAFKPHQRFQQ